MVETSPEKPSLALNRQLARDSEALDIDGGALTLPLRIDSEFLGAVAIGAVAAVRRLRDFSRHRLPRLLGEFEAERVVDLCDRPDWIGDDRAILHVNQSGAQRKGHIVRDFD